MTAGLDEAERATLLRLARASLRESLGDGGVLGAELERSELTPALRASRGAFVSLKRPSESGRQTLRGCVGSLSTGAALYRNVIDVAKKSAFEDPRFPSLTAEELREVRIEISALTPRRAVAGPQEIEIGLHGVQLKKGAASAIFLPQVAVEQRWNVETLLRQLARKAGLAEDEWRAAELQVFEAQVFGE